MDNNNWRLSLPKEEPDMMDTGDWRTRLPPDSRQKILNNITEKLMKYLPFSGAEGMNEARTVAASFEVEIFRGAVDQSDYLRKISMKMLTMETKWQSATDSSSYSFSIPEASNSLPLNPGDLTTQLPSGSCQKNVNKTAQYMKRPSLPSREPSTYDWRTQLSLDSREKMVNKITETLKKHLPYSSPEELRRTAVRFEEKIISGAVSQTDYLRKISWKMLTMETKWQNASGSSSSLPIPGPVKAKPALNISDWRTYLPLDSRKKNANKIKGTLKKHVPNCGQEGNKELERIAASFEELIFNTAIDQVDYFSKISFKMQTMKEGD